MATHPLGNGTKTIGINMTQEMADEIQARADSMDISTSKYCKIILTNWLASGKKLNLKER